MIARALKTLDVRTHREWRAWLKAHHGSEAGVWLVFYKRASGVKSLEYEEALEEALCYGWIDSILRRLDDVRYVRKFTPRKAGSVWSTANRRRYASLKARGLLAAPGLRRAPIGRSGDQPRPSVAKLPAYIRQALDLDPKARKHFEGLAPSYRRAYIGWIHSAKRDDTRKRRLQEAIGLLVAGKKLPMK